MLHTLTSRDASRHWLVLALGLVSLTCLITTPNISARRPQISPPPKVRLSNRPLSRQPEETQQIAKHQQLTTAQHKTVQQIWPQAASVKANSASASLSFFHAEGRDLVSDNTGEKVAFRGVNLSGLEYGIFFDNPYPGVEGINYFKPRAVDLDNIKALGANLVRLPFEWARLIPGWRPGMALPTALDDAYLNLLDEVVQAAADRQIYVVLDMHDFLKYWSGRSTQSCVDTSLDHQQLLRQTWKLVAQHYAVNPAVLGFDIMNEPVRKEGAENCSSCNWHAIAQSVVNEIRLVDKKHLIIVEGPNYSLASNWPIENVKTAFISDQVSPPRIVYSPHVYFDSNNDSRYDQAGEDVGPIVGQYQYYMRDRLLPVIDWSVSNQVPILLGETNVPCAANWTFVLDQAFANFFDPHHISVTAWQYINADHCRLDQPGCSLNLAACPQQYQLNVFRRHPGGVYSGPAGAFMPTPPDSRIYTDIRVNPWDAGDKAFFDDTAHPGIAVDLFSTDQVLEGTYSASVHFNTANFAGVKLSHQYGIDTGRYRALRFWIRRSGQDFKIFTTNPRTDCERIADPGGRDPVYPPSFGRQPKLTDYSPLQTVGAWALFEIPLHVAQSNDLDPPVNPLNSIINSIAFQNMGTPQDVFYLDDIRLIPDQLNTCQSVSGINPTSGAIGSSVTISGVNLTGVGFVRFANDVSGTFTLNNDRQIAAVVPNGAITGPINLSKPACPDVETPIFAVTAVPTPSPTPTPTPTPTPLQLLLDESGPALDQVAALDSVLFLRDPFPIVNGADLLNLGVDRNTRVILFVMNLQLAPGETSSSVVINLIDNNNQSYDLAADDVRLVPNFQFTQVIFRLPDTLPVGTCIIRVKAHDQVSNAGSIRIRI